MGLDYLSKKNWHTGSIKNIAKVWEKEQKYIEKLKKQEEYTKKRHEEKTAYELKQLQVEAGLIPKSALDNNRRYYKQSL
ncbi:hypothetical protein IMG5_202450 [Ichthyophthirius multifiliis]|uniref:CBF1-interacting co-repressor CIR N-terminal domain-containing protein n=1 Tax=Ichthyophthirius multifiliis TaxID=5932 RepID=G0R641_ICHMU|nr:hypothetical protein IMG5_202450 [Ichthyophthirius multifiliis]EGR27064.1 hypothetical protein IMG5_202450 [Ichthyophthirius multifiliis]|eukprot:XP_004023948.1 hypothetical protein IMG5_202450 [Ichthyophthirius multifiliis]